jgi:hypothetical protein
MRSSVFWDITPCSPLNVNRRFGRTCRLHLQGRRTSHVRDQHEAGYSLPPAFMLVSYLAYPSALKMEATCSSETSVHFQRTTQRYILKDRTLWAAIISLCADTVVGYIQFKPRISFKLRSLIGYCNVNKYLFSFN